MRSCFFLATALWTVGCSQPHPPMLRELQIYAPGLEITINGQGNGRFVNKFSGQSGQFSLKPTQFEALVRRMEVFRRSPDTVEGKKIDAIFLGRCKGEYVTDNGGITFRWLGPSIDQYYSVNYGCDRERYAARNTELRAILKSLPVPEPAMLP